MSELGAQFRDGFLEALKEGNVPSFVETQHLPLIDGYDLTLNLLLDAIQGELPTGQTIESLQQAFISVLIQAKSLARYEFMKSQLIFKLELRLYDMQAPGAQSPLEKLSSESFNSLVKNVFIERLKQPHSQLDETMELFSTFLSKQMPDRYDTLISSANKSFQTTKQRQQDLEYDLIKRDGESTEEYWLRLVSFAEALSQNMQKSIVVPIFENAIGTTKSVDLWKRYVSNIYTFPSVLIQNVLYRFLEAFPTCGVPYAQLLNLNLSHHGDEILESVHNALAKMSGEDWKEVAIAELTYLRTMDSHDKAQLEQRTAQILDASWSHDTNSFHSVQRYVARAYQGSNDIEKARTILQQITTRYPNEAENWLLLCYFEQQFSNVEAMLKTLNDALNVSEQLDWPERIFEEALRTIQLAGDTLKYASFSSKIARKQRKIWALRSQTVEAAPEALQVEPVLKKRSADDVEEDSPHSPGKRDTAQLTRDREHLTVSVKNLPINITERQIRQFFTGYGDFKEIKLTVSGETQQANIEFTTEQDLRMALTRDYKRLRGNEVRVQRLQNNTLFITNFPPSYTQENIEHLFKAVGPIANIRFPSLKFNTQRRFCYVEYANSADAQAAVGLLDGKILAGLALSVQISDPSSKQNRTGANEEGREVYINTLDFFKVTSDKVKSLFEKYGTVESVHLPLSDVNRQQGKKNDGYGFVVFKTPEEAQESLELDLVSFEGRAIHVSISKKKSELAEDKAKRAFKDLTFSGSAIALSNLPDTVSAEQLRQFFGAVDEVEDVILEPKHSGAIIVFKTPQASGKLGMLYNGKAIGGYTIQLTSVSELKRAQPDGQKTTATMMIPASMRRKKIGTMTSKPVTTEQQASKAHGAAEPTVGRSNEDFRKMLL